MARVWSDERKLAAWLDGALAALEAWAEVGVIPAQAARAVREKAHVPTPARVAEIERVTDHDLAAFVDAVAEQLGAEGRYVHYGLTSSDVVDTGLSLQICDAGRLIQDGIERAMAAVARRDRKSTRLNSSHLGIS